MKALIRTVLLILVTMVNHAHANEQATLNYAHFENIPVLHEGRIKPLDSFARIYLRAFSGQEKLTNLDASAWLAEALFDPASAAERKLFSIQSKALRDQLELPENEKTFSLNQLQSGIKKTAPQAEKLFTIDAQDRTEEQTALLQLHENVLKFVQLLRSFSLVLPLNIQIPKDYQGLIMEPPNYTQLSRIETQIMDDLKALTLHKGENYEYYLPEEKLLAELAFQLRMFRLAGENNVLLRIMPGQWDNAQTNWFSPWALLLRGHGSPDNAKYLQHWQVMSKAYRNGDSGLWLSTSAKALSHIQERSPQQLSIRKLELEIIYNTLKPYAIAMALYGFCLALLLVASIKPISAIQNIALLSLGLGTLSHGAAIGSRMYILSRPPVGTLYESLLFVSLICTACALFIALRNRDQNVKILSALTGSLSGIGLLALAPYLLKDGESMEMLVAVLNTNFWLATHVICITIGYGICALAAVLAHGYMIMRIAGKEPPILAKIYQLLYRMSLIALLFTAIGTVLGGIWADQSWGRFWGWDPKENGALLIVLWLIWIQHGRQSGHLRPLHYAAAIAYLNVIVALAWFGVNLLSVGLHSYGFTNGAATALALFCGGETLLIGIFWVIIRLKERRAHVV